MTSIGAFLAPLPREAFFQNVPRASYAGQATNKHIMCFECISKWVRRYLVTGGLLLRILGAGMPPGFLNPDPFQTKKMSFSTPILKLGARFSKGPVTFLVRMQIWIQDQINSSTVPSSQTSQFCFVYWYFHCIIFKIIENLILNANTGNIVIGTFKKNLSLASKNPYCFQTKRHV